MGVLPAVRLADITGGENVLVLAPRPGDETLCCGGLIAESCARGRPPFVAVLTDGSSCPIGPAADPAARAAAWERAVRAATARLGLPGTRLLMIGLYDGSVPGAGPAFDALARAIALIMWARDCNAICVPVPDGTPDRDHAAAIGGRVAQDVGLTLIHAGAAGLTLDTRPHATCLRTAAECYGVPRKPTDVEGYLAVHDRAPTA